MASQIEKINQSLTTAEQMKQQTQLVMQPYANWEQYLTPAPLSIAILGELVYISSKTDFSINKNPPKGGYKYIRYPESFRACLMQVCNSGWKAFNGAHKNMDEIRLHTLKVPDYMKDAVKILFQGNDEVVHAHLPDQLDNIRVVADECLTLATVTEKGFTDVIDIIQELLEACVNAQQFYGEELEAVKKKIEENNMRKASSEEALKRSEKAVKTLEKEMNDANESFKSAMDSLPSGWDMIGMDFVGAITECATGMLSGLTSLVASPVSSITNITKEIAQTYSSLKGQDTPTDGVSEINIYSRSAEILVCAETIQQFVQEGVIQWNELYDQKHKRSKSDFILNQLKRVTGNLEKMPDSNPKNFAKKICEEGINICTQLAEYAPTGKCEEAKTKELIQKITKLTESARVFDSKSKEATNSPALVPKSPMMYNEQNKSGKQTPSQKATENARFRIEQSRAQLDKTREVYEKSMENMEKNHKELTEILIALRSCELKEIDFKTTVKMLVKGMDAMGRVKEQWEKMVRFFQMVSNIVKTSLTVSLKNFVSASEKTQSLSYNGKLFSKDLLYNQAFQATNIVNLVHMISGTYTEVSEKHLIDRISTLGKLMAMDKEKPEFQQEHEQLQNSCESAQKAILQLVLKNKANFDKNTNSRLEKIDKELLAVLPKASPEKIKSIEASVKTGFTDDMSNYV